MSRHCISLCWWACWKLPASNFLPVVKLEKIHGTSWSPWCAQDIPAPGVLPMGWLSLSQGGNAIKTVQWAFPQQETQRKTYINVSTPSSISSTVGCSVGPRKILFISRGNEVTIHWGIFSSFWINTFTLLFMGEAKLFPYCKARRSSCEFHVFLPLPQHFWFLWACRGCKGASSTLSLLLVPLFLTWTSTSLGVR